MAFWMPKSHCNTCWRSCWEEVPNWFLLQQEPIWHSKSHCNKNQFGTSSQHDLLSLKCFHHSLSEKCVEKYFWVMHTLAPLSFTSKPSYIVLVSMTYQLNSNDFLPFFFLGKIQTLLKLSYEFFNLTFQWMPQLSTCIFFEMVFEHLQVYFNFKIMQVNFLQLFQLCFQSFIIFFLFNDWQELERLANWLLIVLTCWGMIET